MFRSEPERARVFRVPQDSLPAQARSCARRPSSGIYLGARARAGVIFLLSAYSLSYLISISAAVSAKACGLCALYSAPRARQQLARVAAVCVRSMSFSIHFYQTRPHRHACANRQRRNRSGLASQRVAARPPRTLPPRLKPTNTPHDAQQHSMAASQTPLSSVEPAAQISLGSPAPQSAVWQSHHTHAVRQRAARQQLWPVARRVTP